MSEILPEFKVLFSLRILARAFGSMDCTHLFWVKCLDGLTRWWKGKANFPTMAFNAIVDHICFIQYLSNAYLGAVYDLQIYSVDPFPHAMIRCIYVDTEFECIVWWEQFLSKFVRELILHAMVVCLKRHASCWNLFTTIVFCCEKIIFN